MDLFNPSAPINGDEFYKQILAAAGMLFGLFLACILFILQSGFSSLTYSRRYFLKIYAEFGKQVIFSLTYIIFASFIVIFFPGNLRLISAFYWMFLAIYVNAILDQAKEEGEIVTVFSEKFVPSHYGRFRAYFRLIHNRGVFANVLTLLFPIVIVAYPLSIGGVGIVLTYIGVAYSCVLPLLLALIRIALFIPQYMQYHDIELKIKSPDRNIEPTESERDENLKSQLALKQIFISKGCVEFSGHEIRMQNGVLSVNFRPDEKSTAFILVTFKASRVHPKLILDDVLAYAYNLFEIIASTKISMNEFVISVMVDIGDFKHRNIYLRTSRSELESLLGMRSAGCYVLLKLKNKIIDDLFLDL